MDSLLGFPVVVDHRHLLIDGGMLVVDEVMCGQRGWLNAVTSREAVTCPDCQFLMRAELVNKFL